MSQTPYETPEVRFLGTVEQMTEARGVPSLDKVGSATDAASQVVPGLNGVITPDQP